MSLLTTELKFPSGQTVRKEKEKQKEVVFSQAFVSHIFLRYACVSVMTEVFTLCFNHRRKKLFL